jgi:hypothetical protein
MPRDNAIPSDPVAYEIGIEERVNTVFSLYLLDQGDDDQLPLRSGWTMTLPSGRTVHRSVLQEYAKPLVALGPDAIPALIHWVASENLAIRYIAIFALVSITGISYDASYFDPDADGAKRGPIIDKWRRWIQERAEN